MSATETRLGRKSCSTVEDSGDGAVPRAQGVSRTSNVGTEGLTTGEIRRPGRSPAIGAEQTSLFSPKLPEAGGLQRSGQRTGGGWRDERIRWPGLGGVVKGNAELWMEQKLADSV